MKKLFTYVLLSSAIFSLSLTNAQNTTHVVNSSITDAVSTLNKGGNPVVNTLFDVQFNYNLKTPMPGGSWAAVAYTGTEFWVSAFNRDSIYTLDPLGNLTSSFVVTGVGLSTSGVRSFTYDGNYIYASDNTDTIKIIDPLSKTLVGTIISAAPFLVRGLTWDSTADAGGGGFWVSNFGTGFYLISEKDGSVLDSIARATHTLGSVYNISFDPYSAGGPYIWAFDQTSAGNAANVVRVSRTTGLPSIVHNSQVDVGSGSGLAGGLFITWRYSSSAKTIIGVQQNTARLFGYELNDQPAVDAIADSILFTPPYTQVPLFEATPFNWTVKAGNNGSDTLNNVTTTFTLNDGTTNVFAPAPSSSLNVFSGSIVSNSFGPYTPVAKGNYTAQAIVSTGSQIDQSLQNDTIRYKMSVTDTIMARDNGISTGSLGIGGGTGGTLGQMFTITTTAYLTSITFKCSTPTIGDYTNATVYNYTSMPTTQIGATGNYYFTTSDSLNGVVVTLPITGGPLLLTPGTYFLGVVEHAHNVTLADNTFNYQPNTGWVIFSTNPWHPSEYYGFKVTYYLRPNINSSVNVAEIADQKFGIYPSPASSTITVESYSNKSNFKVELYDMIGHRFSESSSAMKSKLTLDVSSLNEGIYFLKTISGGKETVTKISITH